MHKNAGNFFSCSVSIIFEPADRLHFLHIVDLNIHKDDERHLGLANIKSRLNFVELCWLLWSFWMCNRKTSPRKEATQCRIYRHLSAGLQIFPQLCPKCLLVLWLGWTFAISSDSFHCCRRGSHLFVCGQWHPVLEDLSCVRPEKMAASHDLSNVYRCSSLLTLMLHSLKLTVRPLKMDGWNTILSYWGFSPFSGTTSLLVSGSIYICLFSAFLTAFVFAFTVEVWTSSPVPSFDVNAWLSCALFVAANDVLPTICHGASVVHRVVEDFVVHVIRN